MKMLRLGAVVMFATVATFACSDDDDDSPMPTAGSPSDGGEPSKGGSNNGGNAGKGGTPIGGAEQGGAEQGGAAQGGAAQGGAEQGGAEQGGAEQGGEPNLGGVGGQPHGGEAQGGAEQGGAGGEAPACVNQFEGEGGAGGEGAAFELAGEYVDDWDDTHIIGNKLWNSSGIIEFDADENVVYLQGGCDAWAPHLFSKIVYTEPSAGSFYFCTIDYGLATLEAAKASSKMADDSDPAKAGCGGFAWSKATAQ